MAVALATAAIALPAQAGAEAPVASTSSLPPSQAHAPDRLLPPAAAELSRATARAHWRSYRLPGGATVRATASHYPDSEVQEVVGVLGSLVHGKEINTLSAYLATPEELAAICGHGFASCYSPSSDRMIVPGSDEPVAGIPRQHLIAHEYGHHIANHRLNGPWWPAMYAGTKRWATHERVCEEARQGLLYPGDQGAHYWENPAEGFAESYAQMSFPELGLSWNYTPLLQPDAGSLAQLRADVTRPWTGRRTKTWRRSFGRRHGRAMRVFRTPLDGRLTVKMTAPKGSDYDLSISVADETGWEALRTVAASRVDKRIEARLCARRAVRVEVRRRMGHGPFVVRVVRP